VGLTYFIPNKIYIYKKNRRSRKIYRPRKREGGGRRRRRRRREV